jgi:deazaflavin-dependent oxidoreductase (nitroreductase family)
MTPPTNREPPSVRLHGLLRYFRPIERVMINGLRRYFRRSPGYVLLTTRGRRTGRRHEVLLPCAQVGDDVIVISTYGRRSDWIRNLSRDPHVEFTHNGHVVRGRAEVIDDAQQKQALVSGEPFFLPIPFAVLYGLLWTILRPCFALIMRRWAATRPMVVIRPEPDRP